MTVETASAGEPITKSGPYNGNGVTDTFDYDFQIQDEAELVVTRQNADLTETVLVLTTDYTVTGVGSDTGGTIVLVDAATDAASGTQLVIQYDGDYNQSVDWSNQGALALSILEDSLDKITMHMRSMKELVDRSVKIDAFDTTDLATLQTYVTALGAISSDLSALAAIVADISAVAAIDTDVTTVAAANAAVAAVALIDTEITALAAVTADITTVAGISANVTTVAGIAANVTTLAGIAANVTTVAGIAANVTTVAGLSTEVAALGPISADISSVASIAADVTTVAGISANVTTVASISADITALVAGVGGTLTGDWTASGVWNFSNTGALGIPVGTTAQAPTPTAGRVRYNSTLGQYLGADGASWKPLGGAGLFKGENGEAGDTANGAGDIFRVHEQTLNTNVTIDADENALAAGPLAIASGVTLTVTSGGNLSIV